MLTNQKNSFDLLDECLNNDVHEPMSKADFHNSDQWDDYLLAQQISTHMKAKLSVDAFENDPLFASVETSAKADIYLFMDAGKRNRDIISYIQTSIGREAFSISEKVLEAEKELNEKGIEELTGSWLKGTNLDSKNKETEGFVKRNAFNPMYSANVNKNKNTKRQPLRRMYRWSAAAAACVMVFFLIRASVDFSPKNERIFAKYHGQPEELRGFITRNPDANTNREFEQARASYNSGLYEKAYTQFHALAENDPTFPEASFYSGIAQFEAKQYESSIVIFERVITNFDVYDIEAKWYIALAYIRLNMFEKAVPYLKDVAHQPNNRQTDAKAILKSIGQ